MPFKWNMHMFDIVLHISFQFPLSWGSFVYFSYFKMYITFLFSLYSHSNIYLCHLILSFLLYLHSHVIIEPNLLSSVHILEQYNLLWGCYSIWVLVSHHILSLIRRLIWLVGNIIIWIISLRIRLSEFVFWCIIHKIIWIWCLFIWKNYKQLKYWLLHWYIGGICWPNFELIITADYRMDETDMHYKSWIATKHI